MGGLGARLSFECCFLSTKLSGRRGMTTGDRSKEGRVDFRSRHSPRLVVFDLSNYFLAFSCLQQGVLAFLQLVLQGACLPQLAFCLQQLAFDWHFFWQFALHSLPVQLVHLHAWQFPLHSLHLQSVHLHSFLLHSFLQHSVFALLSVVF